MVVVFEKQFKFYEYALVDNEIDFVEIFKHILGYKYVEYVNEDEDIEIQQFYSLTQHI